MYFLPQASLLSESIFYCGWHLCPSPQQRHLGRLVMLACAQAQQPLVMKAFKMLELTYGTFLLVRLLFIPLSLVCNHWNRFRSNFPYLLKDFWLINSKKVFYLSIWNWYNNVLLLVNINLKIDNIYMKIFVLCFEIIK